MKDIPKIMVAVSITLIMISQIAGCTVEGKTSLANKLEAGDDIDIRVVVPSYVEDAQGIEQEFDWTRLDKLETYGNEFRPNMDKLFNIKRITINGEESKSGCMYINKDGYQDGNTCLMDAFRNKVFMEKYMYEHDTNVGIVELVSKIYADQSSDEGTIIYAGLNAYYGLFSDGKSKDDDSFYSNMNQILTRSDFYSFFYKVNNGVTDLNEIVEFSKQVGKSDLKARMASQVEDSAWLNSKNHGLRSGNYESAITKAEVVYLLANYYYGEEFKDFDQGNTKLKWLTDAGDMLNTGETLFIKDEVVDGWQLGVLHKMMELPKGKMHSDIYKAYTFLQNKGILLDCVAYQEAVTKYEAIDCIYKIASALNKEQGYLTDCEYGTMT